MKKIIVMIVTLMAMTLMSGCATGNSNQVNFISDFSSLQVGDEYDIDNTSNSDSNDTLLNRNKVHVFSNWINIQWGDRYTLKNSNLTVVGKVKITKEIK